MRSRTPIILQESLCIRISENQETIKLDTNDVKTNDQKTLLDQVKNSLVDEDKGITCNKDVSVLSVNFCKQPNMFRAANPFEDQAPYKILTRQYKILETTITPATTTSKINFPDALFQIPAIQKALTTFEYFRSDVEVCVKINSTPYHQGMMMLSFLHDTELAAPVMMYNTLQLSALSPVLLNYSTSDTTTIQYGWLHPQVFLNLTGLTTNQCYIGTMYFTPLVAVANTSGGGDTIGYTVYARFVNPKLAGFRTDAPSGQSGKTFKFSFAPETEEKSEDNMPLSNTSNPILSPLFKAVPLVEDTISGVMDAFAALTKVFDKPNDISTPQKMQYMLGDDFINGAGLCNTNRLTLYPTSKLAHFPISPMCHTSNMSLTELAMVPMLHAMYNFDATHTVKNLYAHPFIVDYGYIGSDPEAPVVVPDYLALTSSLNRFWRGGIKYLLYFVTNSFTTARIRISYILDETDTNLSYGGDFPSQVLDIKGSTISKITIPYLWNTVYRPTWPEFSNPDGGFNLSPKIAVELLTLPIASQGATPFITMVVFRAAAEDFQFASPCSTVINPEAMWVGKATAEGQTSLQDTFKFKFPALTCKCNLATEQGFTTTETVGKISDVCKRFSINGSSPSIKQSVVSTLTGGTIPVGPGISVNDEIFLSPYYQLTSVFQYQRGSMRFRYVNPDVTTHGTNVIFTPSIGAADQGSGIVLWPRMMNPVQTVEVPWIGTVPYWPQRANCIINGTVMEIVDFSYSTLEDEVLDYLSFGDDRLLSYLIPPSLYTFTPVPLAAKKTNTSSTSKLSNEKEQLPKSRSKATTDSQSKRSS